MVHSRQTSCRPIALPRKAIHTTPSCSIGYTIVERAYKLYSLYLIGVILDRRYTHPMLDYGHLVKNN